MKRSKLSLLQSIVSILLCISLLAGTTFAWFTDSVSTEGNIIQSGRLKIGMFWTGDLEPESGEVSWTDASEGPIFNYDHWEPGYTDLKYLKLENQGNLAFQYQLTFGLPESADPATADIPGTPAGDAMALAEVIDVYYAPVTQKLASREEALEKLQRVGTLADMIQGRTYTGEGVLLPEDAEAEENVPAGSAVACVMLKMQESAGNEYRDKVAGDGFCLKVLATQYTYEYDSYGKDYDADAAAATFPSYPGIEEDPEGEGNEGSEPEGSEPEGSEPEGGNGGNPEGGNGGNSEGGNGDNPEGGNGGNPEGGNPEGGNPEGGNPEGGNPEGGDPEGDDPEGDDPEGGNTGSIPTDENGKLLEDMMLEDGTVVPAGAQLEEGAEALTLTIEEKAGSDATLELSATDTVLALDVHLEGLSPENDKPIVINLGKILPENLNIDNVNLFHVEEGVTKEMKREFALADVDAHNEFYYDIITGDVTVAMATFSEVALVADTENAWKGNFDYSWYNADATELTIANADQLAAFGAIVGGMDSQTQNSFSGKTVKLIADISIGDTDSENGIVFYPIGYYNSTGSYEKVPGGSVTSSFNSFKGTFDGNGHTVSNFYQNTWEMFGDYNDGYSGTPNHFRDGMGLFGKVYGGTVKNLTVKNFKSDGEYTTTGVIAAYADCGADFANISIFDCNPRVYNIGNGGIVGCIGWYTAEATDKQVTFSNITVDNSNKISALWGSYDVACGGIVGQYYPTSGQNSSIKNAGIKFDNCHISAQMDVYNDVCANYQYYAYRYTGMLIGSVRENETINGHVYPKMDGITAFGCTVNFGDWNDYYYCELVANSLASYTHDHQFSRLTQVASVNGTTITYLDGSTETVPASGRYNYVVVDGTHATENAACYHFVDGKAHNHDDYNGDGVNDYETVNGESILVENNRHIYLEFNNLFTGYGWGVTSKGLSDFEGVDTMGITAGTQQASVEKFVVQENIPEIANGTTVTVGELFKEKDNIEFAIDTANVKVFVSPVDQTSTVAVEYTADTENWTKGFLKFSGSGKAEVIITDYKYCKETKLLIDITTSDKYMAVFDSDSDTPGVQTAFLYRVGNENNVKLSSLFDALPDVTINDENVAITVVSLNDSNATGIFTANTSDWKKGEIDFNGTGPVLVTIAGDSGNPVELQLEVVNAMNATTAVSATSNNVVLLNDVTNGSFSVGGGHTFYGNGFTITLNPSNHTTKRGAGFDGYVHMTGGILDNVRIEGPIFAAANIYRIQGETGTGADDPVNYFRNAVIIDEGDSNIISNSYISGARAAVYVKGGRNILIENTIVSGGAYANIEVAAADKVTFRNLTTEQTSKKDSYSQNKDMVGIGIVIDSEKTDVYLEGTLNQYNWITQTQWEAMLGSYANQFPKLFTDSTYQEYWHYRDGDNTTKYVNLAMIFACAWDSGKLHDNRSDKTITYATANITVANMAGGVYSVTNGMLPDEDDEAPTHAPTTQYPVEPEYSFNHELEENYVPYTDGDNVYCYEESGTVKISFNEGENKVWQTSILTVTKLGQELSYTVKMGNTDYTGKSITFSEDGNYSVTYTYTDPYNYKYNDAGELVSYSKTYTKTVNITVTVVAKQAKNAEFTMGTSNNPVDKFIIDNAVYLSAQGVDAATLTNSHSDGMKYSGKTTGSWASKTIKGHTFYMPVVAMTTTDDTFKHKGSWYGCFPVFEGAITITDYVDGVEKVYNGSTKEKPATLEALNPQSTFVYQGTTSKVPTEPSVPNTGPSKDKLCYTTQTDLSASNERGEQWTIATYTFVDNKGTTYYWYVAYYCAESTNGCVTPDTLITLANGKQVRVDSLTGAEELLVWNLETGKLDSAPIMFVDSDPEAEYEIIHLYFSDGTDVKVISEHGFWDYNLNRYVYLDRYAEQYIGHTFAKQSGNKLSKVKLTDVVLETETTTAWSPVTAGHLCYFVNGMLSMPGGVGGLFNIFEVDPTTMTYDYEAMAKDIETYGLYTYEEMNAIAPLTEDMFNAAGGAYLKVSIGKGNLTIDELVAMINRYSKYI